MSYLFIDSTYDLSLGVLEDGLDWLTLETLKGQKVSTVIQKRAYELLKKHELNPGSLSGIISITGPGFYTGLRLSEGFSDVFAFFGVPSFSFYSYEIPAWCGVKSGVWFTKAYRGEYFLYHWDENVSRSELLTSKELPDILKKFSKIYVHSEASLDELSRNLITNMEMTTDLLKNRSKEIFKPVLEKKLNREAFYFRAPEDEFKANP